MKKIIIFILGLIPFISFGQTIIVKPITSVDSTHLVLIHTDDSSIKVPKITSILNPKTLKSLVGTKVPLFYVEDKNYLELEGKLVVCKIESYRKSNISGSEGKCVITPLYIDCEYYKVPLHPNSILLRGKNRTNLKFWLSPLIIPIFIPGQGVKVDLNKEFELYIK